jgi:hypothetical protein
MQAFNPYPIQSDQQQSYGGHLPAQPTDDINQIDHSTHPLLIKILNTSWQLISFKIISSMRIINNLLLCRWKKWSTRANMTTEGGENE